jgi:hypothetical protein
MSRDEWCAIRTTGRAECRAFIGLCALLLSACGAKRAAEPRDLADANDTGAALAARSNLERAVLGSVSSIPIGQPTRIAGATVTAEAAYSAASGRTCRAVSMTADSQEATSHRLACSSGKAWFFVPDVFAGPHSRH